MHLTNKCDIIDLSVAFSLQGRSKSDVPLCSFVPKVIKTMQHTKEIPLTERAEPMFREHHLTLGLLLLLGISVISSSHRSLGALQAFSAVLSLPVLLFLCGRLSRGIDTRWQELKTFAVGLTVLFAGSTLPGFWMMIAARQTGSFDLLSPSNVTSLFLVGGECLLAAGWLEQRKADKPFVLTLTVLLGVVTGYLPVVPNPLGLRQFLTFLPLFLMGRWVDSNRLERICTRLWVKVLGVLLLLAALAACFLKYSRLLAWTPVFLGSASYSGTGSALLSMAGGGLRAGQYLAVLAAVVALLSLCPNRPLPVVTNLSQYWYSGIFWHRGLSFLVAALPFLRGGTMAALLRTGLTAVLPLAACLPLAAKVPNWFLDLPQHMTDQSSILKIKRRRQNSLYFPLYCLVFALLLSQMMSAFAQTGHSLIWVPDGENLYLVMMYYSREYVWKVLRTLFQTGHLVLPQWDFSIGQGASAFSVFRINPFYLLALLFPRRWMEYVYALYTLGQVFLCGLAFLYFCRSVGKKDELPVMVGSLVYAFSGFGIFTATKHIYFITYLMLGLPLLLTGCERWLQKRKWGMFVAVVVFLFLGGYYYAWMDSLLMAIYLLTREIYLYKGKIGQIIKDLLQLVGLYLWGMALSMVSFLPSIAGLFESSRSSTLAAGTRLLYSARHYIRLLTTFVSFDPGAPNWTRTGFVGTVFLALVVLFLTRRRSELRPLKLLTLLSAVFLCLPIAGSVFNGMGYATNRWSYGFAMLAAGIVVCLFPDLVRLSKPQQGILTGITLAYIAAVLYLHLNRMIVYSMLLLAALTGILLLVNRLPNKQLAQQLLATATVLALMVHVDYYYSPNGLNAVDSYLKRGSAAKKFTTSEEAVVTGLQSDLYRAEIPGNRHNTFCLTGGNGTSTYWSVLDGTMVDYYLDFDLDSVRQLYALWSLDQRSSLCAVGGVKYYVEKSPDRVPYGFTELKKDKKSQLTVYENQYALPFGYTYDSYLPEAEYDALPPLEKQQAILQGAVIGTDAEQTVSVALPKKTPELTDSELPWTVSDSDGVTLEDGTFEVTKKNGSITLSFEGLENCETYLYLDHTHYSGSDPESQVLVQGGGGEKKSVFYQENSLYYFDRSGYTYNLGYSESPMTACTITFQQKGTYSAQGIHIVCLPMSDYSRDVNRLRTNVLEHVQETPNGGLTGAITLDDTRLLAFAVPYSSGWSLTVNDAPAELMQVNGMYLGTLLPPGRSKVELHYTAPGLRLGAAVSGAAMAVLAGYGVFWLIRRKKQ